MHLLILLLAHIHSLCDADRSCMKSIARHSIYNNISVCLFLLFVVMKFSWFLNKTVKKRTRQKLRYVSKNDGRRCHKNAHKGEVNFLCLLFSTSSFLSC